EVVEHGHELAGRKLPRDLPARPPREPKALARPAMQKLRIVAFEIAVDANHHRLLIRAEVPAALLSTLQVEREAVMLPQVRKRARHAVALEIAGRRADDAAVGGELHRDERGIDRSADAHAQVEAQSHEVDDLV